MVLSNHLSRHVEVAAELTSMKEANVRLLYELAQMKEAAKGDRKALVATKEVVETSCLAQRRIEKKLKALKKEANDLSATLKRHEASFARKGVKTSALLVKSLGSVGALIPPFEVAEGNDMERAFPTGWRPSCKFTSLFSVEVGLNLLEGRGCQYVGSLTDANIVVGFDSRGGASKAVKQAARRILTEYYVSHGREATHANSSVD